MITNTTETATELLETGEKRDRLGRQITPVERRGELVAEYRRSGLTQAEFARREGLKHSTFADWVQKEGQGQRRATEVKFAEMGLPEAVSQLGLAGLEVRLPDGTIVRGPHAGEVAELVRTLRG
jgi:transposase-like protein